MAIVRKDKLFAGYNGNLEHVKIYKDADTLAKDTDIVVDGTNAIGLRNGLFVVLGALEEGEREVYKALLGAEADGAKEILFVHNSEIMYDERLYKLEDYKIAEGKVSRAYHLFEGDIITLTDDLFADAVLNADGTVKTRPAYTAGTTQLMIHVNGLLGIPATAENLNTAKVYFDVIEDAGNELHIEMKAWALRVHIR